MDPLKTAKVLIQENTLTYVDCIIIIYKPKKQWPIIKALKI